MHKIWKLSNEPYNQPYFDNENEPYYGENKGDVGVNEITHM